MKKTKKTSNQEMNSKVLSHEADDTALALEEINETFYIASDLYSAEMAYCRENHPVKKQVLKTRVEVLRAELRFRFNLMKLRKFRAEAIACLKDKE